MEVSLLLMGGWSAQHTLFVEDCTEFSNRAAVVSTYTDMSSRFSVLSRGQVTRAELVPTPSLVRGVLTYHSHDG
jgi:hypothetical protein